MIFLPETPSEAPLVGSGDPEPSAWDMAITRKLKDVGDFLNIRLVGHIIVGEEKWFSMKEEEWM